MTLNLSYELAHQHYRIEYKVPVETNTGATILKNRI